MNEVIMPRRSRLLKAGRRLKNLLWSAAGQFALHGLCPWEIEDRWVMLACHDMVLPNLGAGLCGTRLVHLSDLHCGPLMRDRHLRSLLEKVNSLDPHLVVVTGDFLSTNTRFYARRVAELLGGLTPRVETLAVLGNHDYGLYHPGQKTARGLADYLGDQLAGNGVRVLINDTRRYLKNGSKLQIVGLGEFWTEHFRPNIAFDDVDPDIPSVALVHNPDATPRLAEMGANYVLAGHTHGRVLPQSGLYKMLFPTLHQNFAAGHYEIAENRHLYVNRGLGPSRRICRNTRPEITLFTLRDAARVASGSADWQDEPTRVHQAKWREPANLPVG
jgi:hypothetical protein